MDTLGFTHTPKNERRAVDMKVKDRARRLSNRLLWRTVPISSAEASGAGDQGKINLDFYWFLDQ